MGKLKLLWVGLVWSQFAWAGVYPWVRMSPMDLQVISNAKIEVNFRLDLLRKAERRIDLVTWEQNTDRIGLPIVQALNEAAQRGVQVRLLAAWAGGIVNPLSDLNSVLNVPMPRRPIEYLIIGGSKFRQQGWGYLDGIHEKLLIVDDRIALVTGRGHAEKYLHWLDTGFVFKGPLVLQAQEAFNALWASAHREDATLSSEATCEIPEALSDRESDRGGVLLPRPEPIRLSMRLESKLRWLSQWAATPSDTDGASDAKTYNARLLHFDFLDQMRAVSNRLGLTPVQLSYQQRLDLLQDPFVQTLSEQVLDPAVNQIQLYSLSVNPHPQLREALIQAAYRGAQVEVFTNSREVQKHLVPFRVPIGWFVSLPDLDVLLQAGVQAYTLVKAREGSPEYVHRKVAIVGDSVIFGSHNFNFASSVESDELGFEIRDESFAHEMRTMFASNVREYTKPLVSEDVTQERARSRLKIWFSSFFKGFY